MAAKVADVMSRNPAIVDASTAVGECARLMAERSIGSLGVASEGVLDGVLTDRDIVVRVVARALDPASTSAGEVSSRDPATIEAQSSTDEAERLMAERQVRRLFVVDRGEPVGVVALDDLVAGRQPESVQAQQLGEGAVLRADQGYTGQAE